MNARECAAYLGVSSRTFYSYRKRGLLRGFYLPGKKTSASHWRIHIAEVEKALLRPEYPTRRIRKLDPAKVTKLPRIWIARILGVSVIAVRRALQDGYLKDRTFESMHEYLRKRQEKELLTKVRKRYKAQRDRREAMLNYYKNLCKELRSELAKAKPEQGSSD
jgi:predicted site-specific integrase-resolvase